jgi:hypothetical protein
VAERSRRSAQPSVAGRCAPSEKTSGAGANAAELTYRQLDKADPRGLLGLGKVELRGGWDVVEADHSTRTDRLFHQVPRKRSVLREGGQDPDNAWERNHDFAGAARFAAALRSDNATLVPMRHLKVTSTVPSARVFCVTSTLSSWPGK